MDYWPAQALLSVVLITIIYILINLYNKYRKNHQKALLYFMIWWLGIGMATLQNLLRYLAIDTPWEIPLGVWTLRITILFSAGATIIIHYYINELQGKPIRWYAHVVLGAWVGLFFTNTIIGKPIGLFAGEYSVGIHFSAYIDWLIISAFLYAIPPFAATARLIKIASMVDNDIKLRNKTLLIASAILLWTLAAVYAFLAIHIEWLPPDIYVSGTAWLLSAACGYLAYNEPRHHNIDNRVV